MTKPHFIQALLRGGGNAHRVAAEGAPVIETAWRSGARFDGWDECFRFDRWERAFEKTGIDPAFYANRPKKQSELLPWNHLISGPNRDYLGRQFDDIFTQLKIAHPEAVPA